MKRLPQTKQEEYLSPQCEAIEICVEGGYLLSDLEIPDYGGDEEEW